MKNEISLNSVGVIKRMSINKNYYNIEFSEAN